MVRALYTMLLKNPNISVVKTTERFFFLMLYDPEFKLGAPHSPRLSVQAEGDSIAWDDGVSGRRKKKWGVTTLTGWNIPLAEARERAGTCNSTLCPGGGEKEC